MSDIGDTTGSGPPPTLVGVSVSQTQLGAVYEYVKGNSERMIAMGEALAAVRAEVTEVKAETRQSASALMSLQKIAEARRAEELQDREAEIARKAQADADAREAKQRIASWFSANWRYLGLVALLIFYPQIVGQLQALGVLPRFDPPPMPDPVVVQVPVSVPHTAHPTHAAPAPAADPPLPSPGPTEDGD